MNNDEAIYNREVVSVITLSLIHIFIERVELTENKQIIIKFRFRELEEIS